MLGGGIGGVGGGDGGIGGERKQISHPVPWLPRSENHFMDPSAATIPSGPLVPQYCAPPSSTKSQHAV
eukprot:1588395-Prymnesium_polylepis.1